VIESGFQSTRPRGARQQTDTIFEHLKSFNPRARVGRDSGPSRRVTRTPSFNPRARVGRDIDSDYGIFQHYRFQSTRPRGARLVFISSLTSLDVVSIHAPAWGATKREG